MQTHDQKMTQHTERESIRGLDHEMTLFLLLDV